jgi:predicted nucleic acid-binding protein
LSSAGKGSVLKVYCDTSFLLSFYLTDRNSVSAIKVMQSLEEGVPFTMFHRLELRNGFRLAVFRKDITAARGKEAFKDLETDLKDRTLVHAPLDWADVFREAEKLSQAHTDDQGLRALDILHVASAVVAGSGTFLTFDDRQGKLARRVGLKLGA